MEKLSLNNLFPNTPHRQVSVNSLYTSMEVVKQDKKPSRRTRPFSVDNLIKTQDEVDRKIKQTYYGIYELCLEKIDQANLLQKLDLVFEIPDSLYNCPVANYNDCANYIIRKIRDNYMDATRLTFSKIFITWANIRENKKAVEEKKRKEEEKIQKKLKSLR